MTLLRPTAAQDTLLVVPLDADDADASSGALARTFVEAFGSARDSDARCVVFAVHGGGAAARAGASALVRSLALEWAPRGIRVNAVVGEGDAGELIRFIASPASRMLTGAVLDA